MFTDRFLKVAADLYDTKQADMAGYNDDTKTGSITFRINPLEISHYRASVDDNDELNNTLIHFKNGDSFHVSLTLDKFEKLLNDHQNK